MVIQFADNQGDNEQAQEKSDGGDNAKPCDDMAIFIEKNLHVRHNVRLGNWPAATDARSRSFFVPGVVTDPLAVLPAVLLPWTG